MANNFNIGCDAGFLTATIGDKINLSLLPLFPPTTDQAAWQVWSLSENEQSTTVTCSLPSIGEVFLAVFEVEDGGLVMPSVERLGCVTWLAKDDGSLRLIDNGETDLYAVLSPDGRAIVLGPEPTTKWKFTKSIGKGGTR